jgi:hypothetical protein
LLKFQSILDTNKKDDMGRFDKRILQILSLIAIMQGIIYALDADSEPDWSLIDEQGLFQSEENLVSGRYNYNYYYLKNYSIISICYEKKIFSFK